MKTESEIYQSSIEKLRTELAQANKQLQKEIKKRKQAEEQVLLAKKEWERTFDAIDDFITILDAKKRILQMNRAIAKTFKCDPAEIAGCHCYNFFWNRKEPCKNCPASLVLKDGISHTSEFENRRLGKTFLVSASPIFDETGKLTGIVHVTRDISGLKETEKALQRAYDEMEMKVDERTAELVEANTELDSKSHNLEEANIALKVMLKAREEDKGELEEKVLANVSELVLPYIEKLKNTRLNPEQMACLNILGSNMNEIVSPFSNKLSSKYLGLTPQEIRIANLVKSGKTNKEIAEFMNVSLRTAEFHRENIREKLGLKNKKVNLRSYLLSFQ